MFLTLIENGFAHQRVAGAGGVFQLTVEQTAGGGWRYRFVSPGTVEVDPARVAGGTGLRYVKARLEESFPGAWLFCDEAVAGGWRTTIDLGCASEGGRS